ncbi:extracellular solute-binding protein [Vallitalea pronyensis]|uniref:Extracellular solute-binding protein n=1 Tax=Vallitalea pronyensis TaxID=1348613 RepID=A0A8J8SGW0_9FIRM|nr:extracellular solute-binding protein [Vallitalea pronyensis]QUI22782.1 extracellular solute-binding protein [Vallitalea pronyensis]
MKRFYSLIVVAVLTLAVLVSGCSKNQKNVSDTGKDTPKGSEINQDETIELTMMWWGSQNRHDRTLKVIKLFEEQHPNIKIKPEFSGWSGYWEKIAAKAAANALPDIFQQDYGYLAQYANKDLLEDLYPYVKDNRLDLSDVDKNSYIGGDVNGALYGINLGTNAPTVMYNPAMFEEAGIAEPDASWTWEDYEQAGQVIQEKLNVYAMGDIVSELNLYIRQHGQSFYAVDGKSLGFDEKYAIEFFQKLLDLTKAGILAPPDVRMEAKTAEQRLTVTGKAAMDYIFSNQIVAAQSASENKIKLALIPKAVNQAKEGVFLKPSMFFSVPKSSDKKDAAVQFINFFTNNIQANDILFAERGVPISSKIREALMPQLEDSQKEMFQYIDLVIDNSSKIDPPSPSASSEIDKLRDNLKDQILFEQVSVEEGVRNFMKEANQLLSQ